jgi:hypothetical protein
MGTTDFSFTGTYSLSLFNVRFIERFSKIPRYSAKAIPALSTLLDLINHDPNIKDVRWAAYLLATVMWETTLPFVVEEPAKNKKGPIIKKGKPVMVNNRKWLMTMSPVREVGLGKGRRYHEPVKVAVLDTGGVRITEQDGDQFSVSPAGAITRLTKGAVMGTTDGGPASKVYNDDPGEENAYYGRGYVQLTWWSNYVSAGIALGRGLDLVRDPELVLVPATAYALMSHGMRTGFGFANGRKFTDFFGGQKRDYLHARRMVNDMDSASDIVKLAEAFEAVLLDSRTWVPVPPPIDDALAGAPSRWR